LSGKVTISQINSQIQLLTQSFAQAGFAFNLVSVDYPKNDSWYNRPPGSLAEFDMKVLYRKGSMKDLNLYTVLSTTSTNGILGWCNFPTGYNDINDGCSVNYGTLPNGPSSFEPLNKGGIAVHEVGHWFGLYHPFENGCNYPGDYIDDTPYEDNKAPNRDCSQPYKSCPLTPGYDNIYNFMAVTDDYCRHLFTPGQNARLQQQWLLNRQGK